MRFGKKNVNPSGRFLVRNFTVPCLETAFLPLNWQVQKISPDKTLTYSAIIHCNIMHIKVSQILKSNSEIIISWCSTRSMQGWLKPPQTELVDPNQSKRKQNAYKQDDKKFPPHGTKSPAVKQRFLSEMLREPTHNKDFHFSAREEDTKYIRAHLELVGSAHVNSALPSLGGFVCSGLSWQVEYSKVIRQYRPSWSRAATATFLSFFYDLHTPWKV